MLAGYVGDDSDPELSHDMAVAMDAEVPDTGEECVLCRDACDCGGLGIIPAGTYRDDDGAPWSDEEKPCPHGCPVAGWLQAERNDARADAEELARLRSALESILAAHVPGRVWDERVRALLGTATTTEGEQ